MHAPVWDRAWGVMELGSGRYGIGRSWRGLRGVGIAGEVGLCRCGRGKMGWTSLPLLKTRRCLQSQRQSAPRPPRAHAHGRASRAGRPRVEPAPAPSAAETVLRVGVEFNADGRGCYVRILVFLPFFLPAFTLTLTAFLWKEKSLTCFLF